MEHPRGQIWLMEKQLLELHLSPVESTTYITTSMVLHPSNTWGLWLYCRNWGLLTNWNLEGIPTVKDDPATSPDPALAPEWLCSGSTINRWSWWWPDASYLQLTRIKRSCEQHYWLLRILHFRNLVNFQRNLQQSSQNMLWTEQWGFFKTHEERTEVTFKMQLMIK